MEIDGIVAICGVSCTECKAYQATRNHDTKALEAIAAEWTKGLGQTYTVGDILCDGCRIGGERLSAYCSSCEISLCAKGKGHETCAHCDECPCDKIVAPPAIDALNELRKLLQQL
jgi:hypothetical protein